MSLRTRSSKITALGGLGLASALLLTGCGASGGEVNANELSGLTIVNDGESFTAELDGTIESEDIATKILEEGSGEDMEQGDLVRVSVIGIDASTGEYLGGEEPVSQVMDVSETQMETLPELMELIDNNNIGSALGFYMPAEQLGAESGQILVMKFEEKIKTVFDGEAEELPDEFPTITDDENSVPTMEKTEGTAPKETVSAVRKKGDGETVGADDTVLVNYVGYKWSDGEIFDSSYERGAPSPFDLNMVVKGWKDGLAGKNIGDQVVVIVPPADGYGDTAGHELEEETLVFIVDILYAESTEQ